MPSTHACERPPSVKLNRNSYSEIANRLGRNPEELLLSVVQNLVLGLPNHPRHLNLKSCPVDHPPPRLHQLHRPATFPIDISWDWAVHLH